MDKNIKNQENINPDINIELENLAIKNCILKVVSGSNAYGTNLPTSDWDERGIFVDNISRIILPFQKIEQVQLSTDDIVLYELSKFVPLLLSQNPNVIELLWTDPKDILFKDELGEILLNNRKEFLSIKVKDSYVGYATKQLKRIKGHNKWINSPQPEAEPEQKDFFSVVWNNTSNHEFNKKVPFNDYVAINLGDNHFSLFHKDKLNINYKSWIDVRGNPIVFDTSKFNEIQKNVNTKINPDLIVKLNFRSFDDSHTNWKDYWNWKNNRNEKRSELEEKYGYDTKHAMHLIRLLRSGLDILKYGIVPVKREDAEYLLDIRFGKYSYEDIVKESIRLTDEVEKISLSSKLPKDPNIDLAKDIMLEIYTKKWEKDNSLNIKLTSSNKFN